MKMLLPEVKKFAKSFTAIIKKKLKKGGKSVLDGKNTEILTNVNYFDILSFKKAK